MNRFENPNAEPWFRWIFRRQDSLPFVTVYFLSRKNSTSPRFFPLYDRSKNFRIVVVRGINLPYTDRIGLLLHKIIVRTFRKKINRYIWQSPTNLHSAMSAKNNILLHLDDPLYSVWEQKMIVRLLERSREQKKILVVACTNRYTKDYLNSFLPSENSMIVPQGHLSDFQFDEGDDFIECTDRVFKVVYSSPYIDVKGDKHQDHDMWDSSHLLLELLPKILLFTENVELHLIGKLGRNAEKIVKGESRVVTHGLVPVSTASTLISQCHLGLYPRLADYRRSVQKITEYIGAGIPTLAYKLVDTDIVSEYRIGKVVETPEEFIASLIELSRFSEEFFGYRASVRQIRDKLSWRNIVFDMEKHLLTRNNCIS